MNSVVIQGKVNDIFNGRQVTIATIVVRSIDKRSNVRFDYPQIFFRGNSRAFIDDYKKGDYITVTAEVKSRQVTDDEGRRHFDQYLSGIAAAPASNEMSEVFNTSLRGPFTYKNEIYLEGDFVSAYDRGNNVTGVLIRPDENDFNLYCVSFGDAEFYKNLERGTKICVRCEMQTSIKEHDSKRIFLKSLVITNFGIPEKSRPSDPSRDDMRQLIRQTIR